MSETRRVLGSLGSEMNVGGADYLRRRVQPEETPLQRQIRGMYERREESWRPPYKTTRGGVPSIVFTLFCGGGKWFTPSRSHLPEVKESPGKSDHPLDRVPYSGNPRGKVLAY